MHISKNIIFSGDSTRLDKFLSQQFPDLPRRFFQASIKLNQILVNGKSVSPSYLLKPNDQIEINADYAPQEISLEPQADINFKIVFQNTDFAIIDKPADLTVHPSLTQPDHTLVNGLLYLFPQIKAVGEDPCRPGIVHRLDKNTSGLMMVALNQKAFEYFKGQFQNHQIEKKYQALVWGKVKEEKGEIKTFIGRSKKTPTKQAASLNPDQLSNPKQAVTFYHIIKIYQDKTLVEALPKTGRRHQIRVHLAFLGYPLVGDQKYQTKPFREKNQAYSRHLLHACSLSFTSLDGKKYAFSSEPNWDPQS